MPETVTEQLPAVAGTICLRSSQELERAALICIRDEQAKLNPDNHLIGVLCDTVRLCREVGGPFFSRTDVGAGL